MNFGGPVGSASPPGGNQVDGLPPASSVFRCQLEHVFEKCHMENERKHSIFGFPEYEQPKSMQMYGSI